ncbi:MAG: septum formation initiator family protein, partial [Verrucomicrobia bacterium]|nr:septum formation initiator family protein [Verrucomicrobiota bacterium]
YNRQSKKLTLLQNDPSYTELLARDKLDLMKPGETIFRMEPGPENSR